MLFILWRSTTQRINEPAFFFSDRVCNARACGSLMLNSGKILLAIMDEQYKYYYTIFLVMAFKNIFVCLLSVRAAAAPPLLIFRIFIYILFFRIFDIFFSLCDDGPQKRSHVAFLLAEKMVLQ